MMYTALAAALFAAPAVSAFELTHGKFPGFPKDPENEHNDHDGFKTGGYTSVSYSKCTAKATTKNFSASKDAHVHAVANAWKYACSDDAPVGAGYWYWIYKKAFDVGADYDYGFAFAKAVATAKTECVSYSNYGNAYGCAAAYAYTAAWADAVATAHAHAWSEAYNKCNCNGKWQEQAAASDNYAYDAKYFAVEVDAYAKSYVCAYENEYKAHYDAETCIQHVYFATLAHAVAHAAIDGNCIKSYDYYTGTYKEYAEYTAEAKTEALAVIDVKYVYGCFGYKHDYNPYH